MMAFNVKISSERSLCYINAEIIIGETLGANSGSVLSLVRNQQQRICAAPELQIVSWTNDYELNVLVIRRT